MPWKFSDSLPLVFRSNFSDAKHPGIEFRNGRKNELGK